MKLQLRLDWVLVKVDPPETQSPGGILLVGAQPIRMATVIDVGPGKYNRKGVRIPTELQPGDRFPFFKAVTETKQGHALTLLLEDGEALVRESDVLFLAEGEGVVTL